MNEETTANQNVLSSLLEKRLNLVLISLIFLTVIGSIIFHVFNKAPQIWDSAAHINLAMLYSYKIKELSFGEIMTLSGYYPPFMHIIGAVFFIFVPVLNSPLAVTFLFYIFGLVFLFLLTRELSAGNTALALLVTTVFALFPQVYKELRLFQLDLPLTSLLIAAFYCLHTSKGLTDGKKSVWFFVLVALAQLTKWYAFVFVAAPLIYEIAKYREAVQNSLSEVLANILKGIVIALIINIPWYLLNYSSILNFFQVYSSLGEMNDPQNPLSPAGLTEYYKLISVYQTFYINFAVGIVALILMALTGRKKAYYFLLAILLPYAVFTMLVNKDVRYLMPVAPYFALGIGFGLYHFGEFLKARLGEMGKTAYAAAVGVFLGINVFLYLFVSFNQFRALPENAAFVKFLVSGPVQKYNWMQWNPPEMAFDDRDWKMAEVYNYIKENNPYKAETTNILFAIDYPYFNKIEFDSYQIYDRNSLRVFSTSPDENLDELGRYDFVLTSFNPSPTELRHHEKMFEINRYLANQDNGNFQQLTFYRLPNGEDVYIFGKIGSKFFPTN